MTARLEQLFDRFRTAGDSRALATVFDSLAPELLLLAMHLVRDPHRAEDLVQETFTIAIDRSESFDASRRLHPWLVGILSNVARSERRREARMSPVEDEMLGIEEPVDLVARQEEIDRLVQVVGKLPAPYRDVLNLALSQGMSAAEIAHALGRSPSTVHTQLQRGVVLLRQALPVGFGAGVLRRITSVSLVALSAPSDAWRPVHTALLTDSNGRISLRVAPGDYRLRVDRDRTGSRVGYTGEQSCRILPGSESEVVFSLDR